MLALYNIEEVFKVKRINNIGQNQLKFLTKALLLAHDVVALEKRQINVANIPNPVPCHLILASLGQSVVLPRQRQCGKLGILAEKCN